MNGNTQLCPTKNCKQEAQQHNKKSRSAGRFTGTLLVHVNK